MEGLVFAKPGKRSACVAAAAALSLVAAGAGLDQPERASARGRVGALYDAACPPAYEAVKQREYSEKRVARARRGSFTVHKVSRRLIPPVDWGQDPYDSLAFRGELHSLGWADILFYAYRQGDRGALVQARDLFLDWARANGRDERPFGSRVWFDKVVGDRAAYLGYLIRAAACENVLSGPQAHRLLRAAQQHGRFLANSHHYTRTNRGLFMDFGLLVLGRRLRFLGRSARWRALGLRRFERTLSRRVIEEEGFWLEHSTTYHLLVQQLLDKLLALPGVRAPGLAGVLQRMEEVAGWLVLPDGRILLLGNTNFRSVGEEVVQSAAADDGLLTLPRTGLAFVKSGNPPAYLSVAATFHGLTHKHADELSFDLYEGGRRIVSDTGVFDKEPGRWYEFSRAARAHSVLTVGRRDFPLHERRIYKSGIVASGEGDGWYAIEGRNPLLRAERVRHHRTFIYKPGFALIVVDRVRARRPHTYRRYFQLGRDVGIQPAGESVLLRAGGFRGTLHSWSSAGSSSRRVVRGRRDPLQGLLFPEFRRVVPRWTVTYRTRGEDVDHVATFGFGSQTPTRAALVGGASRNAATVRLTTGGIPVQEVSVARYGDRLRVTASPVVNR